MKPETIKKIKQYESPPKIVKIFSKEEIESLIDLYSSLPLTTFNKKQNVKNIWKFKCTSYVNKKLVAEAEVSAIINSES